MAAFHFVIRALLAVSTWALAEEHALGNSVIDFPFVDCANDTYPPAVEYSVSEFIIDLDKPPEERWLHLVEDKKSQLQSLLSVIKADTSFSDNILKQLLVYSPWLTKSLAKDQYAELVGISTALAVPVSDVISFNVLFEFYSYYTSIVAQSKQRQMYIASNLDFGLLQELDLTENQTLVAAEYLRALMVKLHFKKGNATIYKAVGFAGYIGVIAAVKKDSFALLISERYKLYSGFADFSEWIEGRRDQKWIGLVGRDTMETADTYTHAHKMVHTSIFSSVYIILAGRKSPQGCVVARGNSDEDAWCLGEHLDTWFLVQTNYNHWNELSYDDMATPGVLCMERFRPDQHHIQHAFYKVLSTQPILNKLTVCSIIIDVSLGKLECWLRTFVES